MHPLGCEVRTDSAAHTLTDYWLEFHSVDVSEDIGLAFRARRTSRGRRYTTPAMMTTVPLVHWYYSSTLFNTSTHFVYRVSFKEQFQPSWPDDESPRITKHDVQNSTHKSQTSDFLPPFRITGPFPQIPQPKNVGSPFRFSTSLLDCHIRPRGTH